MVEEILKVYKPRILKAMISSTLVCLFLLIYGLFLITKIGIIAIIVWIIISTLIILITYLNLAVQRYELKEDGVYIKTGIIAKSRGTLLYSQIQDVQEYQDLLARVLGVTSLKIKTMAETSGELINLSNNDARELKQIILSKASNQKIKTTKTVQKIAKQVIGEQEKIMPYQIYPFRKSLLTVGLLIFILLILTPFLFNKFIIIFFSAIIIPLLILVIWLPIGAAITKVALKYYLKKEYLEKTYNFITKSDIHIPYAKIQDLIIKQGILDRILKLASIKVETGEKQLYESQEEQQRQMFLNVIPNLKRDEAFLLQHQILKLVGIKNIATNELRSRYPLNSIKPLKKTLKATFYLTLFLIIIQSFSLPFIYSMTKFQTRNAHYSIDFTSTTLLIIIIFFVLKLIYEIFYFKTYYYADNNELLILKKGVFFIDTLTIPYDKIQHLFVDQDLFDRLFGLWDVHVASAGTTGMQLHIDGLKRQHAEELKKILISRTIKNNKK